MRRLTRDEGHALNGDFVYRLPQTVKISKAVITAAHPSQRTLPLQTVVDRDGATQTALRIILQEAADSGVKEIAVVVCPGDQNTYRAAAGDVEAEVQFIEQREPLGFGHAVFSAKAFTKDEAFLLLVGDHLYLSRARQSCARQLIQVAESENCSVSAVQATHESQLPYFGTVGGRLVNSEQGYYEIASIVEKPSPTQAEQELLVPGLRMGYYLCFFGMHALHPEVMDLLEEEIQATAAGQRTSLSSALNRLASNRRYLATILDGRRYDIGVPFGLLHAQLALALSGKDRDAILNLVIQLLADTPGPSHD